MPLDQAAGQQRALDQLGALVCSAGRQLALVQLGALMPLDQALDQLGALVRSSPGVARPGRGPA